jgi:hypothetical protein
MAMLGEAGGSRSERLMRSERLVLGCDSMIDDISGWR